MHNTQLKVEEEAGVLQSRFQALSLGWGVFIGCLIQCTTLCASPLVDFFAGNETYSGWISAILILIWSTIHVVATLAVLACLRRRFRAQYRECDMEECLAGVEASYVNGTMFGICVPVGWIIVAVVLGLSTSVVNALLFMVLLIAGFWITIQVAEALSKPEINDATNDYVMIV